MQFRRLITACLLFFHQASLVAADKPNIVLIIADDMGFSDIGCYGGEIPTPNLDKLANNGLRFTQFYNTGRCCPTRASLLTGLYPHQAGVGHMMDDRGHPGYKGDLNLHTPTIPELLRTAGYRNYAVGKWHVTRHIQPNGPKHNWPIQRGFDRYYGTIHGAGSYFDPSTLTRDNTPISAFADRDYTPENYYYTDAISDHAVGFISDHKSKHKGAPFFLYVAYTTAHWPMHAPASDIKRYKKKYNTGYEPVRQARLKKMQKLGITKKGWEPAPLAGDWSSVTNKEWEAAGMQTYAAMIECMDKGVGNIVGQLKKSDLLDNTIIFYMQDNGGCAETLGRTGNARHPAIARPNAPTFAPMKATDFQTVGSVPNQTREGYPVIMGTKVLPGPHDTYIAYGQAWANVSNTPFREYKHWVHEGGIATPLIVHFPSQISRSRRGKLDHQPSHLIDLMQTCLDLAGASVTNKLPGATLRPSLTGKPLNRTEPIYWEHEGNRAIRSGKWKLVAKENKPWELYDMDADRTETHDLSSTYPDRVAQLSAQWQTWANSAYVTPVGTWRAKPAPNRPILEKQR